ncbi:AAA family ATPase [Thiospirochaeta perfilievii]|uniref:DNA 3'-5' helicase n=1 Tax=Thiospirochaeta perfilievii TaxID=252967 RepID=A0A5C1QFS2_9SPIO|nr:UvrD-helicase domain-containing protein [Thiospirochaeta perfilievii]QEN05990.1 AAA family ATPase [Thiospirochaeta perfilievii]
MGTKVNLNPEQKLAVDTIEGPVLIIAGAGSGKTGVVTNRIANMLNHGIPQSNILALTFTNKAAREMEERVKSITGKKLSNLTVSTFHAFGVKILREKIHYLGYRPNFTIYDPTDKNSCIKEAARELKLKYEWAELNELSNIISGLKTGRIKWDTNNELHRPLYDEYNEHLKLYNAVDFDDLIVRPKEILESNPEVLEEYQNRYKYIMVDEFQDTSILQYNFIKLLADKYRNICVVGDDDQSIYSWRGANYENLLLFERNFPELKEIKLERNYRSTGIILEAANSVIKNNTNRKSKDLWTEIDPNAKIIQTSYPEDERAEADFIAETIASAVIRDRKKYDDFGILIRTNGLSKAIEDSLLACNIPYVMSGGTSFFQRKEIKDIISYLKLIVNTDDDVNFLRIINTPRRGVGKKSLEIMIGKSTERRSSLYSASTELVFDQFTPLKGAAHSGLADFIDLIEEFKVKFHDEELKISDTVREFVEEIDYWGMLVTEHPDNEKIAKWKYDNIQTFIDFITRWENNPDNTEPTLQKYLNRITLITRSESDDDDKGKVNLMTIHASKGLEFNNVFLAGVEDHILPHQKSVEESGNVEEERRLFYVAITRAREHLYITACQKRRSMNDTVEAIPSRFLDEIPDNLKEVVECDNVVEEEEEAKVFFSRMPWKK